MKVAHVILGIVLVVALAAAEERYEKLYQAALQSDYAYRQVAWMCNRIGPRLFGSPQADAAVRYVADEMRKLGLTVRLEPVQVPRWVRGIETGELVSWPGQVPGLTQKIVLTALGGSVATPPAGLTAEVVVVERPSDLESIPDERIKGRIVLYNIRYDPLKAEAGYAMNAYGEVVGVRVNGAVAAARKGAVASLVRSVGSASFRLPHTGAMRYDAKVPQIPSAAVSAEDSDLLTDLCASGPVRLRLVLTPQTLPPVASHNVVADLPGRERPQEIVLVRGHLDSWDLGTGAIDDAAGVAMAMAALETHVRLGIRPARTLRFVAWMNEENGGEGAAAYHRLHKDEISKHVAAMEMDSGAGRAFGVMAHASEPLLKALGPALSVLGRHSAGTLESVPYSTGADLGLLDEAGVPTFALLQDCRTYFHYHHTAADTLDKIDAAALSQCAATTTVVVNALCEMNEGFR